MNIFYFAVTILVLVTPMILFHLHNKKKLLKQLRGNWGKCLENQIKIEWAKNLIEFQDEASFENRYLIDDKTWCDLDMDELFKLANRTITPIGGQYLYYLLKSPVLKKDPLDKRERLISLFSRDQTVREKIQIILTKIANKNAGLLVNLLWNSLPSKPKYSIFFPILTIFAGLYLVSVLLQIIPWWTLIFIFTINLVIRHIAKRKIDDLIISFGFLGNLISTGEKLATIKLDSLHDIQHELKQNLQKTNKLKRKILTLQLKDSFGISDYINIFFLLDITTFYSALNEVKKHKEALKIIFEIIGQIDSSISIASFRKEFSNFCTPLFLDSKQKFQVEDIYHPLLKNPVNNIFDFDCPNVLITGSNMSGKTTFLKTLGVNAILSQTINMSLAKNYRAPFLKVVSSIGRSDNLISGKSYYFDEVESILNLITQSESAEPILILIDEIFRGTNSVERKAASIEVLDYLSNKGNFILAATHDLDLTEILVKNYQNYHFSETLGKTGLDFDYKIKPGASTTTNAIALLEFVGYPKTIVERANKRIKSKEKF